MTKKDKINSKTGAKQSNKKTSNLKNNYKAFCQFIGGIASLMVILSIGFSSYLVIIGTNELTAKILIVPQLIYASYQLVKKFVK